MAVAVSGGETTGSIECREFLGFYVFLRRAL